jgi:phosphatidylinositol alpha-1,6-mannosyltransferase
MKVLFIALGVHAGVGGLERFNQRVVRSLAELNASEGLAGEVIALRDRISQAAGAPPGVRFHPGAANKPLTAARFAWHVATTRPDVILYGHILLAPLAALAHGLSPRSRHVLFVHGREVWREPFRARVPLWERLAARCSMDRIASVSRLTAERMSEAYGVEESRFRILPNAVDPPVAAFRSRHGQPGEPRLLTVTRLGSKDQYKGCHKVIRALPQILAKVPEARYDLVGDGPLRPELEKLAEKAGVRDRVRFLGYVDEERLGRAYEEARLLVMPSSGEGFGIVFLEAWRHGLPVVAGNQDASAEVVAHGVNGLCVNPYSEIEIAGAVVALLQDQTMAERMGRNGYETVLDRYTHSHFRENLWQVLNS